MIEPEELDDDLDAFIEAIDRALTEIYGPNHQEILSQGQIVSQFEWGNRWSNIREATHIENSSNTNVQKNNKLKLKGVSFLKKTNKYRAVIHREYKQIHLGTFNTPEEAHEAYKKAAIEIHKEFGRY